MAEQTQVQQQVTMKDTKKVEAGKILAEYNRRKRKERAQLAKAQSQSKLTRYGAGTVVAIRALGVCGYYVYQSKETPEETTVHQANETTVHRPEDHKFEMEQVIKWTRRVLLMIHTEQQL